MSEGIQFDVKLNDLLTTNANRIVEAMDRLTNAMESGRKSSEQLGDGLTKVKDPAEIAHRALEGVTAGVKGMAAALAGGDAKGVVEGLTESLAAMAGLLDLVAPGLGAVAAAAVKVGGAFAAMTVGILLGGEELALEVNALNAQLEATFDALGKGPGAGHQTLEMLDEMARRLPQSREQLADWTRAIEKMGVTDLSKVQDELLATASAQAILGESGPAAYEKIARKVHDAEQGHHKLTIAARELTRTIGTNLSEAVAKRMGLSLEQLETKLKAGTVDATTFGDALEKTLIEKGAKGLDALWASKAWSKIKEQGRELFADVDTSPITDAMRNLLVLFDQTQPSGQAAKATITDVFNAIAKVIGSGITEAEVFFLTLEVYALASEVALIPLLGTLEKVYAALQIVGKVAGGLVTGNIGASQAGLDAGAALGSTAPVGRSMALGLITGMLDMVAEVGQAGVTLGEAGVKGTKQGAGVKSPSKPAMEIGGYVAEGLGLGMTGSSAPGRAGRQLSANALGGLAGSALSAAGAAKSNGGVTISGLVINITAPQGVTDAAGLSATGLTIALERLQLASGR